MNIKAGLTRLWISTTLIWVIYCGYTIISSHRDWQGYFEAAHSFTNLLSIERSALKEKILSDNRAFNLSLLKRGIAMSFDEAKADNEASKQADKILEGTDDYKQRNICYESAFEARDRRDLYIKLLPLIPGVSFLLLVLIYWTMRGFNKSNGRAIALPEPHSDPVIPHTVGLGESLSDGSGDIEIKHKGVECHSNMHSTFALMDNNNKAENDEDNGVVAVQNSTLQPLTIVNNPESSGSADNYLSPRGVSGWLGFLVFGLLVLMPLSGFQVISSNLSNIRQNLINGNINLFIGISSLLTFVAIAVSIMSGVKLWKKHNVDSVKFAIKSLWLIWPCRIVLIMMLGILLIGPVSESAYISDLISSSMLATIWTVYLKKSTRVRNTYFHSA